MERCFDSDSLKVEPFQIAALAICFIQDFIKLPGGGVVRFDLSREH